MYTQQCKRAGGHAWPTPALTKKGHNETSRRPHDITWATRQRTKVIRVHGVGATLEVATPRESESKLLNTTCIWAEKRGIKQRNLRCIIHTPRAGGGRHVRDGVPPPRPQGHPRSLATPRQGPIYAMCYNMCDARRQRPLRVIGAGRYSASERLVQPTTVTGRRRGAQAIYGMEYV
jgi:hypothetical protein